MDLYDLVFKELISKEALGISRADVNDLIKYTQDVIKWCARAGVYAVCNSYMDLLDKVVAELMTLRVVKFLNYGTTKESFDKEFLNLIINFIDRYYKLTLSGFIDNEGRVPIKVVKEFRTDAGFFREGTVTMVELSRAILLEYLGLCEILDLELKSLISSLVKS
ncbi:MAG TPA: hypothetical protein ENG05_02705 [Acidilobales archaeon]|nr:hypothetical protein [Acidilobales archaeon]